MTMRWRKLHDAELHDLCVSQYTFRVIGPTTGKMTGRVVAARKI